MIQIYNLSENKFIVEILNNLILYNDTPN